MFRTLLILALPVAFLAAQGGPPSGKSLPGGRKAGRQEQILVRLHRLRVERLQQSLGISEEKSRTIADRWAQFDKDSHQLRQDLRKLHRQVNDILLSPIPEEEKNAKARPLMEQFSTLRQQQSELRRKFEDDIRASLTPAQQARFILVVEEMQRSMLQAIKENRKEAPAP